MVNVTDNNDDKALPRPKKKRGGRPRWREIERLKEKRRLSKELASNDLVYFDLLEDP